jgi:hypothetical protein
MALIWQIVYGDLDSAELFYRRALGYLTKNSKKAKQVQEVISSRYFALKRERGRNGQYAVGGPDVENRQDSTVVYQIGEWQQMSIQHTDCVAWGLPNVRHRGCRKTGAHNTDSSGPPINDHTWWRNCLDGKAQWDEPTWDAYWPERMVTSDHGEWWVGGALKKSKRDNEIMKHEKKSWVVDYPSPSLLISLSPLPLPSVLLPLSSYQL